MGKFFWVGLQNTLSQGFNSFMAAKVINLLLQITYLLPRFRYRIFANKIVLWRST